MSLATFIRGINANTRTFLRVSQFFAGQIVLVLVGYSASASLKKVELSYCGKLACINRVSLNNFSLVNPSKTKVKSMHNILCGALV